jgi:hypothetical protein
MITTKATKGTKVAMVAAVNILSGPIIKSTLSLSVQLKSLGVLEYWRIGALEYWSTGVLEEE